MSSATPFLTEAQRAALDAALAAKARAKGTGSPGGFSRSGQTAERVRASPRPAGAPRGLSDAIRLGTARKGRCSAHACAARSSRPLAHLRALPRPPASPAPLALGRGRTAFRNAASLASASRCAVRAAVAPARSTRPLCSALARLSDLPPLRGGRLHAVLRGHDEVEPAQTLAMPSRADTAPHGHPTLLHSHGR